MKDQETVVADFLKLYAPKHYQSGDITIEMASVQWGIKSSGAQKRLDSMVKDGLLEKETGVILPNGKSGTVFRIVKSAV